MEKEKGIKIFIDEMELNDIVIKENGYWEKKKCILCKKEHYIPKWEKTCFTCYKNSYNTIPKDFPLLKCSICGKKSPFISREKVSNKEILICNECKLLANQLVMMTDKKEKMTFEKALKQIKREINK